MDDSALLDPRVPVLTSVDLLVGEDGPWQANACVRWRLDQGMQADGYRMAAGRLAENAPVWHEQDFLLYPIVFLYRHYVELRLKEVIGLGQKLAHERVAVPEIHDLLTLWAKAKPYIERDLDAGDSDRTDEIGHVERLIREFAALDPRGTAFRYATEVHGGRPLPGERVRLNLYQFADTMDKLGYALDATTNWMHMCLETEHEMAEWFGP